MLDIHADDPEFGYRFIAEELHRLGHRASENRVHRLCPGTVAATLNQARSKVRSELERNDRND